MCHIIPIGRDYHDGLDGNPSSTVYVATGQRLAVTIYVRLCVQSPATLVTVPI